MPNGKTHFIAGAVVGATVNLIIQSTQMAMDYDRPFDWNEFFLCTGAGAFVAGKDAFHRVPNSLPSVSRGPRLCRRPAAEIWNRDTLPNPGKPTTTNPLRLLSNILKHPTTPNPRQFIRAILSSALVAWAISGKHTLKLSRTTRLFLWAFGINHLSHIALDCTTSGLQSKIEIQNSKIPSLGNRW